MKLLFKLSIALLIAMTLTGCGELNVELVKSGVFTDHQNTTVGRAFDAWAPCDSTLWESFETDNGTNIVEYHCYIRESKKLYGQELVGNILSNYSSVEEAGEEVRRSVCMASSMSILFDPVAILQGALNEKQTCDFTLARYIQALATKQSVKVQFTVNLDSTFNVSYVSHKVGEYEYNEGMDIDSVVSVIMGNEDLISEIYDGLATTFATNASESDLVSYQEAVSFLNLFSEGGGTPPEWDGRWQGFEDGVDNLVMNIQGDVRTPGIKTIVVLENGRIGDTCAITNPEERQVILECNDQDDDEVYTLTIADNIIMFKLEEGSQDDQDFTFFRIE